MHSLGGSLAMLKLGQIALAWKKYCFHFSQRLQAKA